MLSGLLARAENIETVCEAILTAHESSELIQRVRGPVTDFAITDGVFYYVNGNLHLRRDGSDLKLSAFGPLYPFLSLQPVGPNRAIIFRKDHHTGTYIDFIQLNTAELERAVRLYNPVNTQDEFSTLRQLPDGNFLFTAREGLAWVNSEKTREVRHVKTSPGTYAGDFIVLPDGRALVLQSAKPLYDDRTKNRIAIVDTNKMTKIGEWGANQERASNPAQPYYQAIAHFEDLVFVATYDALDLYKISGEKFVPVARYRYAFIRRLKVDPIRKQLQLLLSAPQEADSVLLEIPLSQFLATP